MLDGMMDEEQKDIYIYIYLGKLTFSHYWRTAQYLGNAFEITRDIGDNSVYQNWEVSHATQISTEQYNFLIVEECG